MVYLVKPTPTHADFIVFSVMRVADSAFATRTAVPAAGIGFGTVLLVISAVAGGRGLQNVAFRLFALSAVFAVAAFLTGTPAQMALEHAPGMSPDVAKEHWYAARLALSASIFLGLFGIVAIRSMRDERAPSRTFMLVCLLACAAAVASNGWAVYSGIRVQTAEVREQYLPQNAPDLD
jgi:hypothetical protein